MEYYKFLKKDDFRSLANVWRYAAPFTIWYNATKVAYIKIAEEDKGYFEDHFGVVLQPTLEHPENDTLGELGRFNKMTSGRK